MGKSGKRKVFRLTLDIHEVQVSETGMYEQVTNILIPTYVASSSEVKDILDIRQELLSTVRKGR